MVTRRRTQLWADKDYKKANLGTKYKCNPFGGSSHAKGIVVEKIGIEAKQPNSAIRKCCRVQLIKNGKIGWVMVCRVHMPIYRITMKAANRTGTGGFGQFTRVIHCEPV